MTEFTVHAADSVPEAAMAATAHLTTTERLGRLSSHVSSREVSSEGRTA
jgi:hypothetical protein